MGTIPAQLHVTAHVLQTIFLIGAVGCMISIPIIAVKFASVLFERKHEEPEKPAPPSAPDDDETSYGSVG
jgi:hypothetical protein